MGTPKKVKTLAIDYGTSNCGIAFYTEDIKIVLPKATVKSDKLIEYLKSSEINEQDRIIFGLPISMSGRYSNQTFLTIDTAIKIKNIFGCKIFFVDERLTTSTLYSQFKGKVNYKKVKKTKDQSSSVLILSSYIQNPKIGLELIAKEIKEISSDIKKYDNILLYRISVDVNIHNVDIFTNDPWTFWYYYKKGLKSTTLISDLKEHYDLLIISKENKDNLPKSITYCKSMCL
ncbi:hypothetical protein PW5551_01525 [Petrotoga sp. 9PW.55.5.1]|uniref:Holliday junction resolvase RuvX n=1 Tax=Petrotoga sp. 9PW.55.5.1 TaxID=1308979 RepID=UPI000DC5CF67|nr:Holliday junction resolvase RuvX [Petrotoga sp. 9PW.55.5.1]RAO99740.1 hypothetical protein PW5551_01525 [Petrotoga sp. 9PW.55.5.1]